MTLLTTLLSNIIPNNISVPTAILLILLTTIFLYILFSPSLTRRINEPPIVPSYIPYLGSALSFGSNPHKFLETCRNKFGNIFTIYLAGKRMHFLCDPKSYISIFRNKNLSFAQVGNDIALSVLDVKPSSIGIEQVDKSVHQQYTKYLLGADGLNELIANTDRELRSFIEKDKQNITFYNNNNNNNIIIKKNALLFEFVYECIFTCAARAIFGNELNINNLQHLFTQFDKSFPLLVAKIPQIFLNNAITARSELIKRFGNNTHTLSGEATIITQRRQLFITHKFDTHDIGANQMAILWASIANTAPASFWTLAYVLNNKTALNAIKEEIKTYLLSANNLNINNNNNPPWTSAELSKCILLQSAIMEALRLATGSMILRLAINNTEISLSDGTIINIRKGDYITIYPGLAHYDEKIFDNPELFIFDRFVSMISGENNNNNLNNNNNKIKYEIAFLPFGAGVSLCPGRLWAINEIKIFIALILTNINIEFQNVNNNNNNNNNIKLPDFDYSRVGIGVYSPITDIPITYSYKTV